MVGHYWLRAPELAPDAARSPAIRDTVAGIKAFATRVHSGEIKPPTAARFTQVLSIGIGGSALGPEFVADALGAIGRQDGGPLHRQHRPRRHRPRALEIDRQAGENAVLVISKSGGTPETRNGMLVGRRRLQGSRTRFRQARRRDHRHGLAAGQDGRAEGWLARFPMWDWVGGRTSETCAGRAAAGGAARASTSTPCSPAPRPATRPPATTTRGKPGRTAGPRCGITPPAARGRRTWSSCPTRIGCCCSAATCSNS